MAGVFSHRFIAATYGSSGSFTVPAGQVAVVRCVTVHNVYTGPQAGYGLRLLPAGIYIVAGQYPANTGELGPLALQIDMHVVLNAGDQIATANDSSIGMTASGYLFVS